MTVTKQNAPITINYDTINPIWKGETAVLIGGGTSVTYDDLKLIKSSTAKHIAINTAGFYAPWCDFLYYSDAKWYQWHYQESWFEHFYGRIYTIDKREIHLPGVMRLKWGDKQGLSTFRDALCLGGNSGYQAINLAFLMGAKKIVLVGYDMRAQGEKTHFFGDHPAPTPKDVYDVYVPHFSTITDTLAAYDVEIINTSLESAIDCFDKKPLKEALYDCIS